MPLVSLIDWKQFISYHPNSHILQTGEWGELKAAFGWQAVRIINGEQGVQMLFRKLPLGFTLAYLPKPVPFDSQPLWDELDSICHSRRSILLKLEPDRWERSTEKSNPTLEITSQDFIKSPHAIQPPRTIVVNIQGSEDDILNRMKQKCRYNIRLAEKKGITIRAWDDLEGFHKLMTITGGRDGFGVHSFDYYRQAYDLFHPAGMVEMFAAEFEGKPLAALMVFVRGKRAWYLYGASTDEERNRMPTYLLQWEAMRWARAHGAEEYDLWGVPDKDEVILETQFESRLDGLWGVYRFKRGFGGELRRSLPTMDKVYNPLLYKLYRWQMSGEEAG
jgi:lipid II:glycine glycyltransferase (peptidoglycan interpeptide bridge formation enzyme)